MGLQVFLIYFLKRNLWNMSIGSVSQGCDPVHRSTVDCRGDVAGGSPEMVRVSARVGWRGLGVSCVTGFRRAAAREVGARAHQGKLQRWCRVEGMARCAKQLGRDSGRCTHGWRSFVAAGSDGGGEMVAKYRDCGRGSRVTGAGEEEEGEMWSWPGT